MLVAGEDRVDALDASDIERGVLHPVGWTSGVDAGMRKRNDDIGAGFAHFRNPGFRRLNDVARHHLAFEMPGIPQHDLRRHEADQPDLHRMLRPCPVGHRSLHDDVGLEIKVVVARRRRERALGEVGADDRVLSARQHFVHEVEPVIELVVPERRALDAEHVHRRDDRMHVALVHAALVGDVVAHRVALQEVAVVEQDGVGRLGVYAADERRGARRAHRVVRLVGIVVVGKDVDVQVRRLDEAQMRLARLRESRERM